MLCFFFWRVYIVTVFYARVKCNVNQYISNDNCIFVNAWLIYFQGMYPLWENVFLLK